MFFSCIFIIIGFFMLIKGADFLVQGASDVAKKFHVSELLIGLTIVAIGTSLPEFFISLTSAVNGYSELTLGNVIGSNICNLLLILGVSAIITPIDMNIKSTENYITFSLLSTVLVLAFGNLNHVLTRAYGAFLLLLFLAYLLYTILESLRENKEKNISDSIALQSNKNISILSCIVKIIIGILLLKFGGDFVVDNAVSLSNFFGISESIVGLSIVAIGTSLPELATCIISGIKRNSDIAVGNIIGSNILNLLLVLGSSCLIHPITYDISFNNELILLIVSTLIFLVYTDIGQKNTVTRLKGLTLLGVYLINTLLLFSECFK